MLYAVFVPVGRNDYLPSHDYGELGNAWRPVAWFDERERALDYADYLMTINEFAEVAFLPENYVTGSDYVHEIVHR